VIINHQPHQPPHDRSCAPGRRSGSRAPCPSTATTPTRSSCRCTGSAWRPTG